MAGKTLLDITLREDVLHFLNKIAMTSENVKESSEAASLFERLEPKFRRTPKDVSKKAFALGTASTPFGPDVV